jgi:cell division protein FtsL
MLKLLICIFSGLVLAVVLLQLRQQRLELNYQTNQLHNEIEASQARLWSQQLQIAIYTAPNAITQTVGSHDLKLAAPTTRPAGRANWFDAGVDPDAE